MKKVFDIEIEATKKFRVTVTDRDLVDPGEDPGDAACEIAQDQFWRNDGSGRAVELDSDMQIESISAAAD